MATKKLEKPIHEQQTLGNNRPIEKTDHDHKARSRNLISQILLAPFDLMMKTTSGYRLKCWA
jgi:hypothetical protein